MKRTIIITPAMLEDSALIQNVVRGINSVSASPCIKMADQATAMIRIDTPMPSDWIGGALKITNLYSSDGVTGDFVLRVTGSGYVAANATPYPFNTPNATLPAMSGAIQKNEVSTLTSYATTVPDYLIITVRRSGTNPLDTSTNVMEWLGMEIEYDIA